MKKVGRPLRMNFPLVNVQVPEPLMNSERAAMPLGVPRSSGRVTLLCSITSFVCWVS